MKVLRKLNVLIDSRQKWQMAGIVVLMLISGALESLGVGLLVPVMSLVLEPAVAEQISFVAFVKEKLGFTSSVQLAFFFMGALIAVFIIKNLFLSFVLRVQLRFTYTNQFATSRRMMIGFMKRPYEYYLHANKAVIQRSITSDINNTYALLLNILQLISELIVFTGLTVICLINDVAMTLTIATVLIVTLAVIKVFIKPVMIRAGQENQDYYSGLFQEIDEAVTGIKEIKIMGKENYFINEYAACGNGYVNAVRKYSLYGALPRYLIETVAIISMIGYMMFALGNGTDMTALIPQLTVLAAAASRLLPSANRINNYLSSMAFFEPIVMNVSENLQEDIHDENVNYDAEAYRIQTDVEKLPVTKEIEMKDITYIYPKTDVKILDHADMHVPVGKSVGIVGKSGAGKTTLVDAMLGLLTPAEGAVFADGVDVQSNYQGWLKNIGYIPQTIFMLDTTIRKNVAFGIPDDQIDEEKVWKALREAQLDEYVKGLPDGLETSIGERGIRLSGGQRQRIGIARALYEDPEVMVLDEATSALDGETESAIMDSINRFHGKKTLIIIAHRLQTIEKCDLVYRVEDGKVCVERRK